jgi:hypothetical protein
LADGQMLVFEHPEIIRKGSRIQGAKGSSEKPYG